MTALRSQGMSQSKNALLHPSLITLKKRRSYASNGSIIIWKKMQVAAAKNN